MRSGHTGKCWISSDLFLASAKPMQAWPLLSASPKTFQKSVHGFETLCPDRPDKVYGNAVQLVLSIWKRFTVAMHKAYFVHAQSLLWPSSKSTLPLFGLCILFVQFLHSFKHRVFVLFSPSVCAILSECLRHLLFWFFVSRCTFVGINLADADYFRKFATKILKR